MIIVLAKHMGDSVYKLVKLYKNAAFNYFVLMFRQRLLPSLITAVRN